MTDPVDDDAWTAAALARPGIAVYPEMLRRSRPPAQPAVVVDEAAHFTDRDLVRARFLAAYRIQPPVPPRESPTCDAPQPAPRRRWWHRLVHALARSDE